MAISYKDLGQYISNPDSSKTISYQDLGKHLQSKETSLGLPGAFWRGVSVESPTGMLIHGLPKEELDLPFAEEVARSIGGMVDPVSIALYLAGSGIGGAAARKMGIEGVSNLLLRQGLKTGITQAGAFGVHGLGAEAIKQKQSGKPISYKDLGKALGKGAVTGLATGAAAGIPGTGPIGKLARFGAESAAVATVPAALQGRLPTGEELALAPATLGVVKATGALVEKIPLLNRPGEPLADVKEATKIIESPKPQKAAKAEYEPVTSVGRAIARGKKRPVLDLNRLYTKAVDDLHPIKMAVDEVKKTGFKVNTETDPYILGRLARGWIGRASDFLEKGLRPILGGLSKKELLELDEYLAAVRMRSRPDIYTPENLAKVGISLGDTRRTIEVLGPKYAEIANQLNAYSDDVLAHGIGRDSADYQRIKAENEFYAPLYRDFEPGGKKYFGPRGKAAARAPVGKLRGTSERAFESPLASIVKNTYALSKHGEYRAVGEALVNMARESKVEGIADPVPPPPFNKAPSSEPLIKVGEQWYRTDPDVFEALQNVNVQNSSNFIVRMMSVPARALRLGATSTFEFGLRNPVRDVQEAAIYAKYGFNLKDFAQGLFSALKHDAKYDEWRAHGGQHAALVSLDRKGLEESLALALAGRAGKADPRYIAKHPIESMRMFSELLEETTRLGGKIRASKKGAGPKEAAFESREMTLDFARGGPWSRQMNQIIPFWNAGVQSWDKMIRSFKTRPAQTTAKAVARITIPSILLTLHNRKDPRWKDIPDWQKNVFWIFMTEDHVWRFPKPFQLGQIFGSIPERIVEWIADQDETEGEAIRDTLGSFVDKSDFIPAIFKPAMEVYANKSFFTGSPIVPKSEEGKPPELQYTKYTSRTAREIGKRFGYSPAKLDYLWRGYTGGLGRYGTAISDFALNTISPEDKPPEPALTPSDLPVVRAFAVRYPTASGQYVEDFYNMADETERLYRARKELPDKYDRHEIMRAHRIVTIYKTRLSKYRKKIERIEESKTLSPEEKRRQIDDIYLTMAGIAKKAVEALKE